MKTVKLGDIFTPAELGRAEDFAKIYPTWDLAKRIDEGIVSPVLERINAATGQKNDARYLAYLLVYVINRGRGNVEVEL